MQFNKRWIGPIFILFGLFGLTDNLCNKHDRVYLGEELLEKTLVLYQKPERYHRKKTGYYYRFNVKGYPCNLLIIGTAYNFVKNYRPVQNLINEINEGDTIQVAIKVRDETAMNDPEEEVHIIGLKYNTIELIPPAAIEKQDRESFDAMLIFFPALIFIGICIFFFMLAFSPGSFAIPEQAPSPSPNDDHHAPPQNTPGQQSA